MNIKAKRVALIKSLQKALKTRIEMREQVAKNDKRFEDELEALQQQVIDGLIAASSIRLKPNAVNINRHRYNDGLCATIEFKLDSKKYKYPKRSEYPKGFSEHQIREIENALAILDLSEEEFVSASTYKSVSQYIA